MKLEECLEKAGGFPFVAKSNLGDTVEFVGKSKKGKFVGYSLSDAEYSETWCMEYSGWSIHHSPLKWQGEVIGSRDGSGYYVECLNTPENHRGKRFHCTLTEIVEGAE